jgi:hypothetical protein
MTTPRQREDQTVKVKSRWFSVDFKGSTGALIACLLCAFVSAVVWKSDALASERDAVTKQRHAEVMQAIKDGNDLIAYMLSLPMDQREKLKLTMPARLREMQAKQ